MPTKDPRKNEKLQGAVSFFSNSPYVTTGYGVQAGQVVERLKRHGLEVAALSNYGMEGRQDKLRTPYGEVQHYPRGFDVYSNSTAPNDHLDWCARFPDLPSLMITLYDVWVFDSPKYAEIPKIASWTPIDHITLPQKVAKWSMRENVHPIAMAPNGSRLMTEAGIEHTYIPHSVNTREFKPVETMPSGQAVADYFDARDKFVVGMVAANKANGLTHRKSFSENILAFSVFKKKHPDAVLYIHSEPIGVMQGWNLLALIEAVGLKKEDVMFPDPTGYRFGVPNDWMAGLYSGMDVLLAPSMGEGFGVPTIEAQACGTRVIVSDWAASQDLVAEDGWKVEGQLTWDSQQLAWWSIPSVVRIVEALESAYNRGKGRSEIAREFAKQFDTETVWFDKWMPFLKSQLQ